MDELTIIKKRKCEKMIRYLRTAPGMPINATLVMLSLTLTLFLSELLVRMLAPQQLSIPLGTRVDGIMSQRPNIHGRYAVPGVFETTVTINSQSVRAKKEYSLEPNPGVTRIVMLGDSFTFGIGANDAETYPAMLEQVLADSFGATRFEVINAGVGGTGTGEQARQFDRWLKQFHPRIVVLTTISNDADDDLDRGLFVLNPGGDVRPRSVEELAGEDRPARTIRDITSLLPGYTLLSQHSHLLSLARSGINAVIVAARRASALRAIPFSQKENLLEHYRSYGLPLLAREVLWLQQKVRDSGARLVVVFVPEREAVYASVAPWAEDVRWKTDVIAQSLREVCSENEIPFKDLTPRMRELSHRSSLPLYYEERDTHPAPAGYRVIAEEVANLLLAQDDV
jgi:lysophospholipase L1-like esterase